MNHYEEQNGYVNKSFNKIGAAAYDSYSAFLNFCVCGFRSIFGEFSDDFSDDFDT